MYPKCNTHVDNPCVYCGHTVDPVTWARMMSEQTSKEGETMPKIPWDTYYLNIALEVSKRSSCIKRQIGALIVLNNRIVTTGYNGTPRGVKDCVDGGCVRCSDTTIPSGHQLDTCWCCHAEENAVINAAYHGISTNGGVLYTTFSPCIQCAKIIINSGIISVKYLGEYPQNAAALLRDGKVELQKIYK